MMWLRVFLVTAFYVTISISMVFLNKFLLTFSPYPFPFPIITTLFQKCISLFLCQLLASTKRINVMPVSFHLLQEILPLSAVYVLMISSNNLCLNLMNISFYQIARSLSIIFSMILTYFILKQPLSFGTILGALIVFVGFVIGSYGEINFSIQGVGAGLASSFFVALYGIFVKKGLVVVDRNEWSLLRVNSINAIPLLLLLAFLSGEWFTLVQGYNAGLLPFLTNPFFLFTHVLTGCVGFLINLAMFMLIHVTSPLTNTITGTVKASLQTVLSAVFFGDLLTFFNISGIALTVLGTVYYGHARAALSAKKDEAEIAKKKTPVEQKDALGSEMKESTIKLRKLSKK
eukprot:GCRY01003560.1.p1 GENE.GCRY01003560.1~~GCRY01003560.1.p1  ORF type:complete len:345 (-),score=61.55 GCRY01003560.1:1341-2375(-)